MSLFAIADLHLSSDRSKAMDVFGSRWNGYMEKIRRNWLATVTEADTVILPGDLSWALKLEDSLEDFRFLDSLPGQKLIGKGNHDFWWSTNAKMTAFWERNGMSRLRLLYNNAFLFEDCVVCGTRGWFVEESQQITQGETDYQKIVNREVIRLRLSLDSAVKLRGQSGKDLPIKVFLHFPPVWNQFLCREITDTLKEYGVTTCFFGHIHGAYTAPQKQTFEGVDFVLCSADYLNFTPFPVSAV